MFRMTVEDVFAIRNRGVVATGRVEGGTLRVGDTVQIDGALEARVDAIEVFRKSIDEAKVGDNIGVLFKGIEKSASVALDFHKWGQVPYDAGFLLVRKLGGPRRLSARRHAEFAARLRALLEERDGRAASRT